MPVQTKQHTHTQTHVPLTCSCCDVWKYPFTKSQFNVVRKLGPPKSSIVFCLTLSPITVEVEVVEPVEDASRRWTSPRLAVAPRPPSCCGRLSRSPTLRRDLRNILTGDPSVAFWTRVCESACVCVCVCVVVVAQYNGFLFAVTALQTEPTVDFDTVIN